MKLTQEQYINIAEAATSKKVERIHSTPDDFPFWDFECEIEGKSIYIETSSGTGLNVVYRDFINVSAAMDAYNEAVKENEEKEIAVGGYTTFATCEQCAESDAWCQQSGRCLSRCDEDDESGEIIAHFEPCNKCDQPYACIGFERCFKA